MVLIKNINHREDLMDWKDELFVSILDNIQALFILVNKAGKIIFVNEKYIKTINIQREELIGGNLYDIEPDAILLKTLETGEAIYNELDHVESLKIDASGISFPIYNKSKEIIGAASIFNDVSELVEITQELQRTKEMANYLQEKLEDNKLPKEFDECITQDSFFKKILKLAARVADSDSTIMIRGESGVGKGVMARIIHNASKRKKHPLIEVNCASIPESLIESELFGYEEGAYTGAKKSGKMGKFELANKGTIFLDEVGDMSLNMQAKLLRVIQEKKVERVGGLKSISVDVRIIAATNKNLEKMIEEDAFRSDLYYRLNVVSLNIPPLRERRGDIIKLARKFIKEKSNGQHIGITPRVIKTLQTYELVMHFTQKNVLTILFSEHMCDIILLYKTNVRRVIP